MFKSPLRLSLLIVALYLAYAQAQALLCTNRDRHRETRISEADKVSELISAAIPIPGGRPTIAVGHLESDFQGLASAALFSAMEARDAEITSLLPGVSYLPGRFVAVQSGPTERVVRLGEFAGADYAVVGRVTSWIPGELLKVDVHFISVPERSVIYHNEFSIKQD